MATTSNTILQIAHYSDMTKWSAHDAVFREVGGRFPLVPLSKILNRVKDPVTIEDDTLYKRITVRLYGQGVLQRDEVLGKDIGTKRQFIAHAGQLIISRIDARNGAFGIVPEELEGAIVTNDFWLFEVQNAIPEYLILVLSSEQFQRHWKNQSTGTTNRQRIDEKSFISTKIALPDQIVQIKISSRYNSIILRSRELEKAASKRKESIFSLWDELLGISDATYDNDRLFSVIRFKDITDWSCESTEITMHSASFKTVQIKNVCNVNSGGTPSRNHPEFFVGTIPWVKTAEVLDNEITDTEEKITEDAIEKSSARIYPSGCIIVAMYGQTRGQTAKLMIDAATNQACAVLHNINNDIVLTDYLWLYLQGQYNRIRKLAVGSAQPNLNAQMIKDYPIVLPPIRSKSKKEITQERIVEIIQNERNIICELIEEAKTLHEQAHLEFDTTVFG